MASYLRQLLPHYLVLIIILSVVLTALRTYVPGAGMLVQIGIAVVLGLAYPPVLRYLGLAPEPWR